MTFKTSKEAANDFRRDFQKLLEKHNAHFEVITRTNGDIDLLAQLDSEFVDPEHSRCETNIWFYPYVDAKQVWQRANET